MENLPKKIYLNIELDGQCDDYNELDTDEITWSWNQQFKDDVPYVLKSEYDKIKEAFEILLKDHVNLVDITGYNTGEQVEAWFNEKAGLLNTSELTQK